MRHGTKYLLAAFAGALTLYLFAYENWPLALVLGAGVGASILLVVHAYPHDIAPPADRRHENTQRRKGARI